MKKFIVKSIKHSGRKGIRGEDVTNIKYEGMVGSTVFCDMESIQHYSSLTLNFKGHPYHQWWTTSAVIALAQRDDGVYVLETVNAIYELEEIG